MMKLVKQYVLRLLLSIALLTGYFTLNSTGHFIAEEPVSPTNGSAYKEYNELGLEGKLDFAVFERAIEGLVELPFKNRQLITIIDFSKASYEKRLFVLDLEEDTVLYNSLVAHGKNSGMQYAKEFSNTNRSLMSSPGFYTTAETYYGKHGYSLRLDGLEIGINDHARERAIVVHGANYVSEQFIKAHGRIGRSWGCPALPPELTEEVINLIKDGSCLYIHTDEVSYLNNSVL